MLNINLIVTNILKLTVNILYSIIANAESLLTLHLLRALCILTYKFSPLIFLKLCQMSKIYFGDKELLNELTYIV